MEKQVTNKKVRYLKMKESFNTKNYYSGPLWSTESKNFGS